MRDNTWSSAREGRVAPRRPRRLAVSLALTSLTVAGGTAVCGAPAAERAAAPPADAGVRDAALADTLVGLITTAYDFSRPGVEQRLLGLYAPGAFVVSAAAGRITTSRAALAQQIAGFWSRVGQNMRDPRFVVRERYATALGPDAAALTLTYAIPHQTPEGRPHTLAGAWTAVFQRRGGRWVIVQEHLSDLPAPAAIGQLP
ncbi:MAG TPA: DUF4440 domain-containing protein [Gemmatirosa sp.]